MAFDWIGRNWYFLEVSPLSSSAHTYARLYACTETLNICTHLNWTLKIEQPTALALDSNAGFVKYNILFFLNKLIDLFIYLSIFTRYLFIGNTNSENTGIMRIDLNGDNPNWLTTKSVVFVTVCYMLFSI